MSIFTRSENCCIVLFRIEQNKTAMYYVSSPKPILPSLGFEYLITSYTYGHVKYLTYTGAIFGIR